MKSTILASTLFLILTGSGSAFGQSDFHAGSSKAVNELAQLYAQIKSEADLYDHLTYDRKSPLNALSQRGKDEFLKSLTFNDQGLTSFQYDVLERELTPTEVYGVLRLFGLQGDTYKLDQARAKTTLDQALLNVNSGNRLSRLQVDNFTNTSSGGYGTIGDDNFLEGYRCVSSGTCAKTENMACTSNC